MKFFFTIVFFVFALATACLAQTTAAVEAGVVKAICAPWDGPGFSLHLSSNIIVQIYTAPQAIQQSGAAAIFTSVEHPAKSGDALVSQCDATGSNCVFKNGMVTITTVTDNQMVGTVQFAAPVWGRANGIVENHLFRVRYDRSEQPVCG